MSNLNAARPGAMPAMPPGGPIASFRTYAEAQRAVDYLSDQRFPVQFVSIVGTELNMVERVTGRMTYARAAMAGALSGAYFGMFVGLFFSLFEGRSVGTTLAATLPIGAGFGLIYGLISYSFTGGRRDFTSTSQIVAGQYAVWCAAEHADAARQLLRSLPGPGQILPGRLSPPFGQVGEQPRLDDGSAPQGAPYGSQSTQPGQGQPAMPWPSDTPGPGGPGPDALQGPPQQGSPPSTMPSGVRLPPGYGPPPGSTPGWAGTPAPNLQAQPPDPSSGSHATQFPPPDANQQIHPPGTPASEQWAQGQPGATPAAPDAPRPTPTGPTYGEMMARKRAEARAQADQDREGD